MADKMIAESAVATNTEQPPPELKKEEQTIATENHEGASDHLMVDANSINHPLTENHSVESQMVGAPAATAVMAIDPAIDSAIDPQIKEATVAAAKASAEAAAAAAAAAGAAGEAGPSKQQSSDVKDSENDGDKDDLEMEDQYSDDGSEYEPEPESPKAKKHQNRTPAKTPNKSPKEVKEKESARSEAFRENKTPKTPLNRVRGGRVDKSTSPITPTNLRCPVFKCGQTFTGRNPRQSLWHHLKYYATRGLPDRAEFEKAHAEAHAEMKREAEPKGTPVERNRVSSSDYRKKNPEKAKTSARLSNFRARARKKGLTNEQEIEDAVQRWEKEWQEKQAKEASEYFSGILLSAFE